MSDDLSSKNAPVDGPVEPRHILTKAQLRAQQMEDINYLIGLGVPKLEIARRIGVSAKTLYNIIHKYRDMDLKALHQEAVDMASRRVASKLNKITEMTLDQTLAMKDRSAGLSILKDTGVLDTVRPSGVKRDDESRITFEFNFAPPPWAPKAMSMPPAQRKVKLHEPVQIAEVVSSCANEDKPELSAESAPVDVPPRD